MHANLSPSSTSMKMALWFVQYFYNTSKTGLQRPAATYDGIGKIGGGYGFLVSMVSRVVRCPWLPSWGPCGRGGLGSKW